MSNIDPDKVVKKKIDIETLLNHLLICGKTYDYRDESKHVEEKRQRINSLSYLSKMFKSDNLVEKLI